MAARYDDEELETLARVVRRALGREAEGLTDRQLRALVRQFVDAGAHAVRLERTRSPREAARLAAEARQRLAHARHRAAETSEAGRHRGILVPPAWRHPQRVMEAHRDALVGRPGVVGCGIAYRHRGDAPSGERCVVVMVEEKIPPAKLRGRRGGLIPPALEVDGGPPVPTDVVEVGEMRLKAAPGGSLGPTGTPGKGTLGVFAEDLFSGAPVALTAMHLLEDLLDFPGTPPRTDAIVYTAPCDGEPQSRRLGRLLQGTRSGVDAAKISVDDGSVSRLVPGIGNVAGWRLIDVEADRGIGVALRGAVSGVQRGKIRIPLAFVEGLSNLGKCIVAAIPAAEGDSGAALLDEQCLVLGLLVGGSDTVNAFSPIGDVLSALSCDIPSTPS